MLLVGDAVEGPVKLPDLLGVGLANRPDEVALVSTALRMTWREIAAVSDRLAKNLLGLGLAPGDRVASLVPNRIALLVHYLACMKAGLVAVPLNYRYMAPEIDHALEVSGAAVLLAHAERDRDLARCKSVRGLRHGLIACEAPDRREPNLEALMAQPPTRAALPSPDPAAPAFIFFTSGSTGPAKGVTHSLETMGWILASAAAAFELTAADVMLPGSSLSHLGGFYLSFAALATGARVLVSRNLDSLELLGLLRAERPTVLCMLPAALFRLVRDHGALHNDFRSLRVCRSGGDKVPVELALEFTELTGLPIDEGYGMTEVGFIAFNPPSGVIKPGSVGRAVPGLTLSLRGPDGQDLPAGNDGVVWIRSRSNTIGYFDDPAASRAIMRDGWLDSGDLMRADTDGYLWFRGRKKQIIVHDGSNISPQEVEEALRAHDAVESAGVVGVHDLLHGENVRAYVAIKKGAEQPTRQQLIEFARERIGYKAPEEIEFLDEMPLNPTGKIDRAALKRMAEERHGGGLISHCPRQPSRDHAG